MQRLVRVADATTLVVERDGLQTAVTLADVDVPPARRAETVAYLETMVGAWMLVENGNVYRSPDGAFVNAEVRRRLAGDAAPSFELHPMTILGMTPAWPQRSESQHGSQRVPEKRAAKPRARAPSASGASSMAPAQMKTFRSAATKLPLSKRRLCRRTPKK